MIVPQHGGGTVMKRVTRDGWCVSTETGTGIKGARLGVFKVINNNPYKIRYGDHHGKMFADSDKAFAFALKHGYCKTYSRVDRFGPVPDYNNAFVKMHFESGRRLAQKKKDAA